MQTVTVEPTRKGFVRVAIWELIHDIPRLNDMAELKATEFAKVKSVIVLDELRDGYPGKLSDYLSSIARV